MRSFFRKKHDLCAAEGGRMENVMEHTPSIRYAKQDDLPALLAMQRIIQDALPDKRLCVPLTADEMADSIQNDALLLIEQNGKAAAFAALVFNRRTDRSLASHIPAPFADVLTVDAVAVLPAFRGQGLQRHLLQAAQNIAKEKNIPLLAATVSPDNVPSLRNFVACGYTPLCEKTMYGGLRRLLLTKKIL